MQPDLEVIVPPRAATESAARGLAAFQSTLVVLSVVILASVIAIMCWALHWQLAMLDRVSGAMVGPLQSDAGSLLLFIGRANFAVVKTCALCFAFVLIFLGSVYVLWPHPTMFNVKAEHGQLKTALTTSSPGLAMIALGVGLTALIVFYKTSLSWSEAPASAPSQQGVGIDSDNPRMDFSGVPPAREGKTK